MIPQIDTTNTIWSQKQSFWEGNWLDEKLITQFLLLRQRLLIVF